MLEAKILESLPEGLCDDCWHNRTLTLTARPANLCHRR